MEYYRSDREIRIMNAKRDRLSVEVGTVLAIPIRKGSWALGQVIYPGISFYMGIGLKEYVGLPSADDIKKQKLTLFSWTNDAEIYKNRWKNLGVCDIQEHGELPEYKILISGKTIVESFFGEKLRNYDPDKDRRVQFKTVRSPLLVQDAVRAAVGVGEWRALYDQMKM